MNEQGGVRSAWLNLRNIVEASFPGDDRFRRLYALSPAAMHSRSCRGIDLLLRAADMTTYARRVGLLVLERLSDLGEEMDHLSAAAVASVRMDHAAAFGGAPAAATVASRNGCSASSTTRSFRMLIIQEMARRRTLFLSHLILNIIRPHTRCSSSWASVQAPQGASWTTTHPGIFATDGMGPTESTGSKRLCIHGEPVRNDECS